MPGEADDYLYVAISQTQFVFAKVMKGVSPYDKPMIRCSPFWRTSLRRPNFAENARLRLMGPNGAFRSDRTPVFTMR